MEIIYIKNCVIKSYHEYKVTPLVTSDLELQDDREYSNTHDTDACGV
jgi:hypothetical protein